MRALVLVLAHGFMPAVVFVLALVRVLACAFLLDFAPVPALILVLACGLIPLSALALALRLLRPPHLIGAADLARFEQRRQAHVLVRFGLGGLVDRLGALGGLATQANGSTDLLAGLAARNLPVPDRKVFLTAPAAGLAVGALAGPLPLARLLGQQFFQVEAEGDGLGDGERFTASVLSAAGRAAPFPISPRFAAVLQLGCGRALTAGKKSVSTALLPRDARGEQKVVDKRLGAAHPNTELRVCRPKRLLSSVTPLAKLLAACRHALDRGPLQAIGGGFR